jgi:L-threonylcarbamoyladenylate synthase
MMKRYSWQDDSAITEMSALLQGGGVLAGSSDTVFGLLTLATDAGKKRLDAIKGRQDKPYLVLARSVEEVYKLVDLSQLLQIENLLQACWPGPLTVIFNASPYAEMLFLAPFPSALSLYAQIPVQQAPWTIAVRVPKHAGLQKLLAQTGPLFSTSANKTGQSVPSTLEEMDSGILSQVDGIVLDGADETSTLSTPSTIINATGERLVMVREGAYSKAELESKLGVSNKRF